MPENFTLLLYSQHYPVSQQVQFFTCDDLFIDADIAEFLQAVEQQPSHHVLDCIHAFASKAVLR